jgi:hypothetical protein
MELQAYCADNSLWKDDDMHYEMSYVKWRVKGLGFRFLNGLGGTSVSDRLSNGLWEVQKATMCVLFHLVFYNL